MMPCVFLGLNPSMVSVLDLNTVCGCCIKRAIYWLTTNVLFCCPTQTAISVLIVFSLLGLLPVWLSPMPSVWMLSLVQQLHCHTAGVLLLSAAGNYGVRHHDPSWNGGTAPQGHNLKACCVIASHRCLSIFLILLNHIVVSLLCRSQDFVRVGQLYLVLKTKLIVTSSWDTSLCTVCASPWPASFFYSPPSWSVFVAAKTHVQLFRMGKYCSHYSLVCTFKQGCSIDDSCLCFFRFWFFKFLILIGITVGAFFIPDGTFHNGTHMLQHFYSTFLRHSLIIR